MTPAWLKPVCLTLLLLGGASAQGMDRQVGYPTFLSPHTAPIALHGERVFVVNTPADTLDVIDVTTRAITARINTGIDPVSIAIRPDGKEAWVSNHVSDSVSVIDIDPASPFHLQVVATIQDLNPATRATLFDEPAGIAFVHNEKAYVALSSQNQIAVVDVASRAVTKKLLITAQDPRAIRVHGDRLYVIPFESGNRTQISGCVDRIDGNLCTFDATEHVVTNNNVLSLNAIVDIVKHPQYPDRDLYVYDTETDQLLEVIDGLGTLLYGMTINSRGRVYVAQTDARNDVNGRAGTQGDGLEEMENRAFLNQITWLNCGGETCRRPNFFALEPPPPVDPASGEALATPFAIEISPDDTTLFATAASSNMLFTVDAASGAVLGRTMVEAVPRGIALQANDSGQALQAWVLNAVANTVSLVDVANPANPQVVASIGLQDPTHPVVKRGRMAFNDANASTTGTFSCESCHPDGGTDQLAWVLDTPICNVPGCDQIAPRITMPIRGLRDTAPYHWDGIPGDPYGGNNTANINGFDSPNCNLDDPATCTLNLVDGGLASTMCRMGICPINEDGKGGALTAAERDDMARFLLSVPYPPAQRRAYTNILSSTAVTGFSLFHIEGDLQGDPQPNVCGNCHRMPFWVSTNTPGTGMDAPTWRGAYDRPLVLPQGRLNIIDFSFFSPIAAQGIPERSLWRLSWGQRPRFDPVWNMVLEGSTGFSGAFARQATLNQATADSAQVEHLLGQLEAAAGAGGIVLQADGGIMDDGELKDIALQYDHQHRGGSYRSRTDSSLHYTRAELLDLAARGTLIATLTGRLGPHVDVDHPQPALWSQGTMHNQKGPQIFPTLVSADDPVILSARHIRPGANLYLDGRRVPGSVTCQAGALPECANEIVEVRLASLPRPDGMHLLQVQNPGGLFSNDYIMHSADAARDNCADIPNPDQQDSDSDGVGDRCDDDAFGFAVEPGISGAWYDPAHDGEGWFVQVLSEDRALVYWFTYTPPAVGGELAQAWIGGVGEIRGSSIVIEAGDSFISRGPPFGPDFDPDRVDLRPWGKFVLSFSDCNSGVMYYRSIDPDFGHGSLDLTRLSSLGGLGCGSAPSRTQAALADGELTPAISGAWYDPAHDGEGWVLEMLADGRALLAWFSYDPSGEQAWFVNTGVVQGNTIQFDLLIPSGTDFGPTFEPGAVQRPDWGTATFTFDDCNSGTMTYTSPVAGYGSGGLNLVRLTKLAGHSCE